MVAVYARAYENGTGRRYVPGRKDVVSVQAIIDRGAGVDEIAQRVIAAWEPNGNGKSWAHGKRDKSKGWPDVGMFVLCFSEIPDREPDAAVGATEW